MKHSLQLKLSQHLTLTPQLQQSIRLLQLSTLELNQEIERLLQENPLLEKNEEEASAPPPEFGAVTVSSTVSEAATANGEEPQAPSAMESMDLLTHTGNDNDW